jgi:nicotinamide riboside kinase
MEAERRQYDLYLLMDIDVPWQDDSVRCLPNHRKEFFDDCKEALDTRGRKYITISGPFEERFAKAVSAVEELLKQKKKKLTYEIKRPSIPDMG